MALLILFTAFLWLFGHGNDVAAAYDRFPFDSNAIQESAGVKRDLSLDVSQCPGYSLNAVKNTDNGLTAHLTLAGKACNAFGLDIAQLTIEVTYETKTRLHVHIYDTAQNQYTIPNSVISRPGPPGQSFTHSSDLVFNYNAKPFAFWIARRSDPHGIPLFDTRTTSLPKAPIHVPVAGDDSNSTRLDSFELIFEDQYLQMASALPHGANIYGLGEVVATSGIRRDIGTNGGQGTIQTMWARDDADPEDKNIYGSHSIYMEHRLDAETQKSSSHGVFLLNPSGSDTLLLSPNPTDINTPSLIEYRLLGGTLDFYFLSGPTPIDVIEQYGEIVGTQTWVPYWGFGFQLCRWGYANISETREQVMRMKEAGIPLEVMWNDIDLYHAVRDFTTDPVSFPIEEVSSFIQELSANHQHYIPIVDAAIAKQVNATDIYDPYTRGTELDAFIKNPDKSEYVGQVWPGYTVFPDWFANDTQQYWTEALTNWSKSGVAFSGIWLDMNEPSSFCEGSCGSGIDISNTSVPFLLPGAPGNLITDYPEGYDSAVSGPSGNITVNGQLTFGAGNNSTPKTLSSSLEIRGLGSAGIQGANINDPPYTIHNGFGPLAVHTVATNATHANGVIELDVHNLWGLMEEKATHNALLSIHPGQRPFLISRSTFPSSGKWTGHWLGDNFSKWSYMHYAIQGVLQFQLFQIPLVGSDTGGFSGNTDEELLGRWMQLSAFHPFYRNHNVKGAIGQEPYRWDSVANASKIAISARYSLLPYWYTLFANTSLRGTPPVRALFWEFPTEQELFGVDAQFMVGSDILVTPVLTPNVSTVDGIFPGRGKVIWRDFWTHSVVETNPGGTTTLPAPLGHIPVHIREGAALLLHDKPGYTIEETRQGPFGLLLSLAEDGHASGTAYVDDGISYPPGPNAVLTFRVGNGELTIERQGAFEIGQKLETVTVLGVGKKPTIVKVNGKTVAANYAEAQEELVVENAGVDLNARATLSWE